MGRSARAKSLTKRTRYTAEQALSELYDEYRALEPGVPFGMWAVTRVWDVDYKPTAGKLIVILDLNETTEPATKAGDEEDCMYMSNGVPCRLYQGHEGDHTTV